MCHRLTPLLATQDEGWVIHDRLLPEGRTHWAKAASISGGVPLGDATQWTQVGPPRRMLSLRISGHAQIPDESLSVGNSPFPGARQTAAATRIQAAERGRQARRPPLPEPELSAQPESKLSPEERYVRRFQAAFRSHRVRQYRRWAAEDPESMASIGHILRANSLGHLLPYFVQKLRITWEKFCQLTPKRLGGVLYPHVDFDSSHTASMMRIRWGVRAPDHTRLSAALRKLRIQQAAQLQAATRQAEQDATALEMAQLRLQRAAELEEHERRKKRLMAVERNELLQMLRHNEREKEAAQQLLASKEKKRRRLQGTVAAAELRRREAEATARALRKADGAEATLRAEAALAAEARRSAAMRRVPGVEEEVSVMVQPQLGRALEAAAGRTSKTMRFVPEDKLQHAGKVGVVLRCDREDDSVLLRVIGGVDVDRGTSAFPYNP